MGIGSPCGTDDPGSSLARVNVILELDYNIKRYNLVLISRMHDSSLVFVCLFVWKGAPLGASVTPVRAKGGVLFMRS